MPLPGPELTGGAAPLFVLMLALALDAAFGGIRPVFRYLPHPVAVMGAGVGWFDRRLNREKRSWRARAVRGAVAALVMVGLSALAGWGMAALARALPYGWLLELLAVTVLLAQRSLFVHVHAVARGLVREGADGGRAAVRHIVGRDTASLDGHGVARAAIESLAENFADGVVAPVFWYALLGLPGLVAYKCVNTMDSMIGHRTERHAAFGATAARLDDAVNAIPARLAGVLIAAAAAFAPAVRPARAFKVMLRDAGKHRSFNAGWPEAAMAGALGVALAGPRRYGGEAVADPWIGDEFDARAGVWDIHRALYLFIVACLMDFAMVAILFALRLGL